MKDKKINNSYWIKISEIVKWRNQLKIKLFRLRKIKYVEKIE